MSVSTPTNGALAQTSTIKSSNGQVYVPGQKASIVWLHSDKVTGFTGDDNFPPLNKELDIQSTDFDITYNNLQSWSYDNRKIGKIVYHVHAHQNKLPDHFNANGTPDGGWNVALIEIGSDPTNGLELQGVNADISIDFYYDDGSKVNFKPGTAYFAVGSLNNYQNQLYGLNGDGKTRNNSDGFSIEHTNVVSGGQAVGLAGSSVTPHGSDLYSTNPNSVAFGDSDRYKSWIDSGNGFMLRNYNVPDGTNLSWDTVGNPNQYYGAGLIRLNGDELKLQVGERFDGIPADATARNFQWWNMSTIIPETPTQEIHYHYIKTILLLIIVVIVTFYVIFPFLSLNYFSSYSY